jgi:hypothetical protein
VIAPSQFKDTFFPRPFKSNIRPHSTAEVGSESTASVMYSLQGGRCIVRISTGTQVVLRFSSFSSVFLGKRVTLFYFKYAR